MTDPEVSPRTRYRCRARKPITTGKLTTTEAAIMETIKELMRGRTTLIITHRIATVHDMGKIVVLRNGRVVEVGMGPELVARGGAYAELYHSANLG